MRTIYICMAIASILPMYGICAVFYAVFTGKVGETILLM